jgi:hypothetical protein
MEMNKLILNKNSLLELATIGKKRKRTSEDIEEATNYEAGADFEASSSCSNAIPIEDTIASVAPVLEGNMDGAGSGVAAASDIIINIESIIPKQEICAVTDLTAILRRATLGDPTQTESVVSGVSSNLGIAGSQLSHVSAPQAEIDVLVDSFSFISSALG